MSGDWQQESEQASRPSLPQHLLFVEVSMQETTFVSTDEGRNGTQEIKVWAPQLKQLMDRDRKILQCILDLTDWRGLHMTSTPGTTQRPTEWAAQGRARGSGLKVTSTVPVRGIPAAPQLETIRCFLANSLLVELKAIHVVVDDPRTLKRDHRRISVTIQVRGIHRENDGARVKSMDVNLPRRSSA